MICVFVSFSSNAYGGALSYWFFSFNARLIFLSISSRHTWRTSPIFRLCKPSSARFVLKPSILSFIWTSFAMQAGQGKSVLQLRVAGSAELLTITCPSMAEAENMADLVDGYCRLVNQSSTSIWSRKGKSLGKWKSRLFWQSALISSCANSQQQECIFARNTNNISPITSRSCHPSVILSRETY